MKKFTLILACACTVMSFSQSFQETIEISGGNAPFATLNGTSLGEFNSLTGNANEFSKIMGVSYDFDDIRFAKIRTDGSFLLFENWDNPGYILVGDKKYTISNVNYHLGREELMTKFSNDSIFLFDLYSLDKFSINDKVFTKVKNSKNGTYEVLEIIFESDNLSLYKKHSAEMHEASSNPMLNRPTNKIIKDEDFMVLHNGNLEKFILRKKDFLNLVPKENRKDFEHQVKGANLSFKNETDTPYILNLIVNELKGLN